MPLRQIYSDSPEAPGKAFTRRPSAVHASCSGRHLGGSWTDVLSQSVHSGLCIWWLMQSKWRLANHLYVTCRKNTSGNETGFEDLSGKVIITSPLSLSAKLSTRNLPSCVLDITSDWGCQEGLLFVCDLILICLKQKKQFTLKC